MPKQVSEEELEAIRRAVGGFLDGASIDEISDSIEPKIHRRTLQRRLAVLVERKQLLLEGKGRGSQYRVPPDDADVNIEVGRAQLSLTSGIPEVEIYTPISEVSARIKRLVRQPIQHRRPVGYNRTELLADVFVWAYERSCARYSAARQSLGDPDPFRLRYREFIAQLVSNIVRSALNKREAVSAMKQFIGREIVEQDRARFMEMVETELTGLHEGNIARYSLKPSEFASWLKRWR